MVGLHLGAAMCDAPTGRSPAVHPVGARAGRTRRPFPSNACLRCQVQSESGGPQRASRSQTAREFLLRKKSSVSQKFYLIHVFRQRLNYPDLRRAVVRLTKDFAVDKVLIEDRSMH